MSDETNEDLPLPGFFTYTDESGSERFTYIDPCPAWCTDDHDDRDATAAHTGGDTYRLPLTRHKPFSDGQSAIQSTSASRSARTSRTWSSR